jgi:kynureninase
VTREDCLARDAADPLGAARRRFVLPEGVIYLDGNSLGPLPAATGPRLAAVIAEEWGEGLIRSWNAAGWIDAPHRVGDKIARLIGARPGTVVAVDSTSVNLFKVLAAACALRPGRSTVLSEPGNFPTDLYIAEGLTRLAGGKRLKLVDWDEVVAAIDADTAVVMLTHVDYRSGRGFDMGAVTRAAHDAGALVVWDLAHSAGAMRLDLAGCDADFAVGCGYKYLNGGPGAPAFLYVAPRWQEAFSQPLSGWLGHAAPFAFEPGYRPAPGVGRYVCGTPPILSLAALEVGVDTALTFDLAAVRAKSQALVDLFVDLVETRCAGHGLRLATPRQAERRGSQVCFAHPDGYPMVQALVARGVIGDFRAPDILRFGFAPLYVRFVDVWDAVEALRDVLASGAWRGEAFATRAAVT